MTLFIMESYSNLSEILLRLSLILNRVLRRNKILIDFLIDQ